MSVTVPPLNQFATDAYAYLEPITEQDEDLGYPLMALIGALGSAFDQVEQVARALPGMDPYQQVYDVDLCPAFMLIWLGQFVGVVVTPGATEDVQRQQVRAEVEFYRGTIPYLIAKVIAQQTAPGGVTILERIPDAWGIAVVFDPAFTPDPTLVRAAAATAIPWGIFLTVNSSAAPLFEEGTLIPDTLSSSLLFDTATLDDIT